MRSDTAPGVLLSHRRKPLAEMSDATLADFFKYPNSPVLYADIASAVPGYNSYKAIKGAVDKGHLRPPTRLPNDRCAWRAGAVVQDLGLEQLRAPDDQQSRQSNGGGAHK